MEGENVSQHISLKQALELGPPPIGSLSIPIFNHGSMEAKLYTPDKVDSQTPHTRDEIYIVAKGSGEFFNGEENVRIEEGSFLFVAANVEHRFLNFTEDFAVWVVFYGPEGGEKEA